jgi:hypothetical protein
MSLQEASISALTREAERRVRSATFSHGVKNESARGRARGARTVPWGGAAAREPIAQTPQQDRLQA